MRRAAGCSWQYQPSQCNKKTEQKPGENSFRSTLGTEVPFVSDPLLDIAHAGSISSRSLPDVPSP